MDIDDIVTTSIDAQELIVRKVETTHFQGMKVTKRVPLEYCSRGVFKNCRFSTYQIEQIEAAIYQIAEHAYKCGLEAGKEQFKQQIKELLF